MDCVVLGANSTIWLKAHARYDDHHPEEALEVIKAFPVDKGEQKRVRRSAIHRMIYSAMAGKTSHETGSQKSLSTV